MAMLTQHDAEEAMRPTLGRLFDARDEVDEATLVDMPLPVLHLLRAQDEALTKALDLLEVRV